MLFKRKEYQEKAILIEKKIIKSLDKGAEVRSLYNMKYGRYNTHTSKDPSNNKANCLIFMTKRGSKTYYVSNEVYQQIKIDSLLELTILKGMIQSYNFIKIANKGDILELGW